MAIALANGGAALVDEQDRHIVAPYEWRAMGAGRFVYAIAYAGGKDILMHRLIAAAKRGELVDHRNHDGLDNRRANLRKCTPQQNQFNRRARAGTVSGLKGVTYRPERKARPWRAVATLNGKGVSLGSFSTREEAHEAYRDFSAKHHGEFLVSE